MDENGNSWDILKEIYKLSLVIVNTRKAMKHCEAPTPTIPHMIFT